MDRVSLHFIPPLFYSFVVAVDYIYTSCDKATSFRNTCPIFRDCFCIVQYLWLVP